MVVLDLARNDANKFGAPIPTPITIPVHILTGFLGSGKTTLLNRLIRDPAFANSAVVINEFGDIGVDHLLVSEGQDATMALVGGCLCCELRDGLGLTLVDLLARRRQGRCLAFERIIIETSGLADPTPILNLLVTEPVLRESIVAGGVLAVVDALNANNTMSNYAEAVAQVVLADQIVVTKTDLLDVADVAAEQQALERQLRAMNSSAAIHVLDAETSSLSCLLAPVADAYAQHEDSQEHPQHRADSQPAHTHVDAAGIHTFCIEREAPIPGAALTLFVQALAAHLGADLLRVKGFVYLAESAQKPMLLQGAQCVFHPLLPHDAPLPASAPHTRLVFIARTALPTQIHAFVDQLLDALIWEAADISARLIQSTSAASAGGSTKESVSCLI